MDADRNLTAAAERGKSGAFGGDGEARGGIVEEAQSGQRGGIVGAGFKAERALTGGGTDMLWRDALTEPVGFFQAIQAGGGEQDGIDLALGELAQARVHVAAKFNGFKIRPQGKQLRAAAQATGAEASADG